MTRKSVDDDGSSVLHEMRSTFTTKGLGLMKPQTMLNEPSESRDDSIMLPQIGPAEASTNYRSLDEQVSA